MGKGEFKIHQTRFDNGDWGEEFIIVQVIPIFNSDELSLIETSVNFYWNDANQHLDGRSLGGIEKKMYESTADLTKKLLKKWL